MAMKINKFERLTKSTRSEKIQLSDDNIIDIDCPNPETECINNMKKV